MRHLFIYLVIVSAILIAVVGLSCSFDCLFRTADAQLLIFEPEIDGLVDPDTSGFIDVEGFSSNVYEQICPNKEIVKGGILILVKPESPHSGKHFIQKSSTSPDHEGWWIIKAHLGDSVPSSGEQFLLTGIVVASDDVERAIAIDTVSSLVEFSTHGIDISSSSSILVKVK